MRDFSLISSTSWIMFTTNILFPLLMFVTFRLQCRESAEPTPYAGIRLKAFLVSPKAWKAGHAAASRWSMMDMITIWVAALVLLFLVRGVNLTIGETALSLC